MPQIIPTESSMGLTMELADLIIAEVRQVGSKLDALTEKVDENMERTAALEEKIRPLFNNGQPGLCAQRLVMIEAIEKRVSALENWRMWVLGIVAAVGAMAGGIATWLGFKN